MGQREKSVAVHVPSFYTEKLQHTPLRVGGAPSLEAGPRCFGRARSCSGITTCRWPAGYRDEGVSPFRSANFEMTGNTCTPCYANRTPNHNPTNNTRPSAMDDGTFLKSRWVQTSLLAVGVDGNIETYIMPWALVESENTSSWSWFLTHLSALIPKIKHSTVIPN